MQAAESFRPTTCGAYRLRHQRFFFHSSLPVSKFQRPNQVKIISCHGFPRKMAEMAGYATNGAGNPHGDFPQALLSSSVVGGRLEGPRTNLARSSFASPLAFRSSSAYLGREFGGSVLRVRARGGDIDGEIRTLRALAGRDAVRAGEICF